MPEDDLLLRLDSGLRRLGIALSDAQKETLIAYLRILEKWNRAYNLTAVRNIGQMVERHLLDSLAVLPLIRGRRCIDVGSGAGLPGLPLAVASPRTKWTLLDSSAKKTRFLIQAAAQLGLSNIEVIQNRVEQYTPPAPFDTVTARAFSPLGALLRETAHLLATGGQVVALKGKNVRREMTALPSGFTITATERLEIPGAEGERYAVVARKEP